MSKLMNDLFNTYWDHVYKLNLSMGRMKCTMKKMCNSRQQGIQYKGILHCILTCFSLNGFFLQG